MQRPITEPRAGGTAIRGDARRWPRVTRRLSSGRPDRLARGGFTAPIPSPPTAACHLRARLLAAARFAWAESAFLDAELLGSRFSAPRTALLRLLEGARDFRFPCPTS
jgi:hypothetical protein